MPTLTPEMVKGTKTYYDEALLKVSAVSKYNAEQIAFEGLDGYWTMTEFAMNSTKGKVPPVGAIAVFKLATNPKKGENAKPGSMYRDIMNVRRATPEEVESYVPQTAQPDAKSSYADKELPAASPQGSGPDDGMYDQWGKPTRAYWDDQAAQIKVSMAFNNLTAMLFHSAETNYEFTDFGFKDGPEAFSLWQRWFNEASRGLPLTPVVDEEPEADEPQSVADARELDEQAQSHLSDTEEDYSADSFQDVQELPW